MNSSGTLTPPSHDDEDVDKVTAKANELIRKMRGE
jgi:hypothetical protein